LERFRKEEESEEIFEFVMDESELQDMNVNVDGREVYSETVSRKMVKESTHEEWQGPKKK